MTQRRHCRILLAARMSERIGEQRLQSEIFLPLTCRTLFLLEPCSNFLC